MIANLLNTLLGLWLAYVAIFPDALAIDRDRSVMVAAIVMILLALWARRSDFSKWQSTVAIATGALVGILAMTHQLLHLADVLMFWGILWAGLVSATVALWAALYRPPAAVNPAE